MNYEVNISIEVVKGGFVLSYPVHVPANGDRPEYWLPQREVFTSPRKLIQKMKSVLDDVSLVPSDDK